MNIKAPGASLVAESTGTFACDDGTTTIIATETSMEDSGKAGYLKVTDIEVPADESFPVNLLIDVDGALRSSCSGYSNDAFHCGAGRVFKP
jgi:hypothetical protein